VGGGGGFADLLGLGALVDFEDFAGSRDDCVGEASEAGYFYAVAFARGAGLDGMEEDDAGGVFADGDADVAEVREAVGEEGEFVVVGGEEGADADVVVEVFDRGPGRLAGLASGLSQC
jgi:hypothetical protein